MISSLIRISQTEDTGMSRHGKSEGSPSYMLELKMF